MARITEEQRRLVCMMSRHERRRERGNETYYNGIVTGLRRAANGLWPRQALHMYLVANRIARRWPEGRRG